MKSKKWRNRIVLLEDQKEGEKEKERCYGSSSYSQSATVVPMKPSKPF